MILGNIGNADVMILRFQCLFVCNSDNQSKKDVFSKHPEVSK